MSERMSWEEIKEKYPDQWVGLVDIDWKNSANVRSAVVKYVGKSRSELLWLQESEEELVSFYTTPDNIGQMGFLGIVG